MLRGHVFSEQIFGVDIFALFINQFLGGHNGIIQDYKNAMEMTNTSNSITISNGVAVIQGRYLEEHTETVLSYAKTDSLYCSLVIEIDLGKTNTKTSLEQARYKILEAENDYPTLIQNDIANQEGNIYQFELARFQNGSTGIINFTDRRSYLSFDSVYSGIIQDNLNSDSSTSALSAKQGKVLNEKINGDVLYENETGTTSNITLSKSAEDYQYIEIFYFRNKNRGLSSCKLYLPNNKKACLSLNEIGDNNAISMYSGLISILGTSMTWGGGRGLALYPDATVAGASNVNEIKIYRVIGYK